MRITKHKPDRDRVFLLRLGVSFGSTDSMASLIRISLNILDVDER